tara:strand:+ start:1356 stop:1763 length:408 start_codon:yes stop_codon:yes gene_type:complete
LITFSYLLANPLLPTLRAFEQGRTVNDGVYTSEQATRGQVIYDEQCGFCHGEDMSGGQAPGLAGQDFVAFWDTAPLSELVNKIQTTMPQSSPGMLSGQDSTDIVAYMLQVGEYPTGDTELSADTETLDSIVIAAP